MSKIKWVIIIIFAGFLWSLFGFNISSDILIKHILHINPLSWIHFWIVTLIAILLILPWQLKISIIIEKIQKINKVFLRARSKNSPNVQKVLQASKLPSKNKIMLILFLNVIIFGFALSIFSNFNLHISTWVYIPVAVLLLYFSTQISYKLFINKIKNRIFTFLIALLLSIGLLMLLNEASLIFILCQTVVLKIVLKYYRDIKRD